MIMRSRERLLLLFPMLLLLVFGILGPALFGLMATFTSYSPFRMGWSFVGLDNYRAVLRDPEYLTAVRNVLVFTALMVPLALALGTGLAAVVRTRRRRVLLRSVLLIPWLVSPVANGVMWHFLLSTPVGIGGFVTGWLGMQEGASPLSSPALALLTLVLVEVWRTAPLVAFLVLPLMASIPAEPWEEATMVGASRPWQARNIVLPRLRTLLVALAMLLTGLGLGTFDSIVLLTGGGPGSATMTPALKSYIYAFKVQSWPLGAASGWLIAIAVLIVGAAYVRFATSRTGTRTGADDGAAR